MAAIIRKSIQAYEYLFNDIADNRLMSWPLVAKPFQGIAILTLYLMFVLKWGPKWMKNRQPYNLDKVMIVYNALQVIACTYLFIQALILGWGWKFKWVCEPIDYSDSPEAVQVAKMTYLFLILKVADLMDTVFFVLRKKYNQVSFLHVYHHTGMVMLVWGSATYYPGGHGSLVGVINCFVHSVMYSYYLLTVAKPSIKKAIWLKKHITQLQILQFFICVVHMSTVVFKPKCDYPRWISALFLPQDLFMLALFIDFYKKTYVMKLSRQAKDTLNETLLQNGQNNKLNGHHDNVTKKSDLNECSNGSGDKISELNLYNTRFKSLNNNYRHSYKDRYNHCEKNIENNNTKYKKKD